jgi:hypothetical protein
MRNEAHFKATLANVMRPDNKFSPRTQWAITSALLALVAIGWITLLV